MKVIHLVDGTKAENGYTFNNYSTPSQPNKASMYDFMASTYTGEYISWQDESKTVVETVLNCLDERCGHKETESDTTEEFFVQPKNVRWVNDEEDTFYSVWIENGEPTGDAFKIESIKDVQEGQKFSEGAPIEI